MRHSTIMSCIFKTNSYRSCLTPVSLPTRGGEGGKLAAFSPLYHRSPNRGWFRCIYFKGTKHIKEKKHILHNWHKVLNSTLSCHAHNKKNRYFLHVKNKPHDRCTELCIYSRDVSTDANTTSSLTPFRHPYRPCDPPPFPFKPFYPPPPVVRPERSKED